MNVQQLAPQEKEPKSTRSFRVRLVIGLIALFFLIIGGLIWILNTGRVIPGEWSTILPIIFIILAAAFALLTWLFPFSPIDTKEPVEIPFSIAHIQVPQPSSTIATSPDQQMEQPQTIWNVPYRQNPFFTGREHLLKQLHERLTTTRATALTQAQAISGLGGIGKTQTAIEYAYLYRSDYHFILWVNAVTQTALIADFVTLATLLQLPEKDEQDQQVVVAAVKRWLATHSDWLLILDNADDLTMVSVFLPTGSSGHILLTTRAQATGTLATSLEVEKLDTGEGILLLLRRARLLPPDASLQQASEQDRATAQAIVQALDGLPLALDQAGAYIEETGCSLATYLERYQQQQITLLQRRGGVGTEHPEPVARTWTLSFAQVEQQSEVAADLLRLCAFLDPDTIPEELFTKGAAHLGPVLHILATDPAQLDEAIGVLRRYSLIQRNRDEQLLIVHRLVQAVLKATMTDTAQQQWAERVIRAVNHIFPTNDVRTWPQCRRLLPQALACAALIEQHTFTFPEAVRLLNQTAYYLYDHALYAQAQPFLQHALAIREEQLGPTHPDTVSSLNNLANLYRRQGKYAKAEPLYQRALSISEQQLGPMHPNTATSLNNLAGLYKSQGKYTVVEPLLKRALAIREQQLGPTHPNTATSLNDLALLYQDQGNYEQAEPLYQRALSITEKQLGPEHPSTATSLNNLALLYQAQGKYEQAEPLYLRALAIKEKQLGPEHPDTATSLNNLAELYRALGKYEQAETFLQRALAIREKQLGPEHPNTATSLNSLANLYRRQDKYAEAERLYLRALSITEKQLGPELPITATSLKNLASLYYSQGKYAQAEPLYQRALAIMEQQLGPMHSNTTTTRENYQELLSKMKQRGEDNTRASSQNETIV
jgi:tetratricopeptide (TPR) repeat protein